MPARSIPYPEFNYVIYLNQAAGSPALLGAFSEVAGLMQKKLRSPNQPWRSPGLGISLAGAMIHGARGAYKVGDVTLKRGVVDSGVIWSWLAGVRNSGQTARQSATVTLRNEQGQPIISWKLTKATPVRYSGPPLGKGSSDVAVEELVLSVESIAFLPPH